MTKIRKPLIFTLCLIPVAAVGGWSTAQMSTASADKAALEAAIQQVGSKEMVMLITMIQTVVYAVICGFFGYLVADKIGLIRPFRLDKKNTLITLLAGALCGIVLSADAFTFAKWIPELADSYEKEQSELKAELSTLSNQLENIGLQEKYVLDFIEKAKANIELKEVTPELLRAFISRIEVYEKPEKYSRTCGNTILIRYTFQTIHEPAPILRSSENKTFAQAAC